MFQSTHFGNAPKRRVPGGRSVGVEIYSDTSDTEQNDDTKTAMEKLKNAQHKLERQTRKQTWMNSEARDMHSQPLRLSTASLNIGCDRGLIIRGEGQDTKDVKSQLEWGSSWREPRRHNINFKREFKYADEMRTNFESEDQRGRGFISAATASKRAPLKPRLHLLQASAQTRDRPGSGPGKENLNPWGCSTSSYTDRNGHTNSDKKHLRSESGIKHRIQNRPVPAWSKLLSQDPSKRSFLAEGPVYDSNVVKQPPGYMKTGPKRVARNQGAIQDSLVGARFNSRLSVDPPSKNPFHNPGSNVGVSMTMNAAVHSKVKYPLIQENIIQPQILAEDWLDGMDSVILQLGNELFQLSNQRYLFYDSSHDTLRQCLLQLYHDQPSLIIYQKLKASLQDGALSMPEESVQRNSTIRTDIGLRTRFINLWIDSYDLFLLKVAVEVITGCEIPGISSFTVVGSHSDTTGGNRPLKKHIAKFLDSCILRNEDAPLDEKACFEMHSVEYSSWSWQRTMLRSLMLVYLLDRSKDLGLFATNLFLSSSNFKSSTAVLKQISTLFSTSSGDLSRPLTHLGYHARHAQYALDEYQYDIKNLATDLRDGVRLTRLVELLICLKDPHHPNSDTICATITQNKAVHNLAEGRKAWVLSQHLKYPCPGRSQKIHNVQIALSALNDLNGISTVTEDLDAADIVDGHREKTIAILWGMLGRRGLDLLVNFCDLKKEIRRFDGMRKGAVEKGYNSNRNSEGMLEGSEKQIHQLKAWAKGIAELHGLEIRNLTTSFANGLIFHKIVDEYNFHIPSIRSLSHGPIEKASQLETKLIQLGCNSYFGK